MKNNKISERLTASRCMRITSAAIAASIMLTLTACGDSSSQQDSGMVTEENSTIERVTEIPNEPGYNIAPGADIPETSTEEPSSTEESPSDNGTVDNPPTGGEYTYTVYDGITINMDVNIDDDIMTNDNGSFFELYKLMFDYDWLASGTYSEKDDSESLSYASRWYSRVDGELMTIIEIANNDNHLVSVNGRDVKQFYSLSITYSTESGEPYYNSGDTDIMHSPLTVEFSERQGTLDYRILGNGGAISRDDIVLISYIIWTYSNNPGINPLISFFGDTYRDHLGTVDTHTRYLIP
ncbi:MAG: hypothetical protein IJH80_04430 [Ruminococcus sp.]|nr:hypothetical protein [Ruminococcus sp.]